MPGFDDGGLTALEVWAETTRKLTAGDNIFKSVQPFVIDYTTSTSLTEDSDAFTAVVIANSIIVLAGDGSTNINNNTDVNWHFVINTTTTVRATRGGAASNTGALRGYIVEFHPPGTG